MSAGNFGDVIKHMVLLELVDLIKTKDTFHYFETHGNRMTNPVIDSTGVMRINKIYKNRKSSGYGVLNNNSTSSNPIHYFSMLSQRFAAKNSAYPSSWCFVRDFLSVKGIDYRFDICEIDRSNYVRGLIQLGNNNAKTHYHLVDGFELLPNFIATDKQIDLVLIDPYYKDKGATFANLMHDVYETIQVLNYFNIPYVIWYPEYSKKFRNGFFLKDKSPNYLEVAKIAGGGSQTMLRTGMVFSPNLIKYISPIQNKVRKLINNLNINWII